ncbi:hypothetical protein B0T19DRAFT_161257 [Cercophora scortea]|uniref:Uncharacterized protein n=1 Tax=Cercophora scortea TaxID=314031 RepID=A0AAE0ILN8_9PEZI|nr:hypothetical protein B0T19DRAFT_161257 [Cercophora scortea]
MEWDGDGMVMSRGCMVIVFIFAFFMFCFSGPEVGSLGTRECLYGVACQYHHRLVTTSSSAFHLHPFPVSNYRGMVNRIGAQQATASVSSPSAHHGPHRRSIILLQYPAATPSKTGAPRELNQHCELFVGCHPSARSAAAGSTWTQRLRRFPNCW